MKKLYRFHIPSEGCGEDIEGILVLDDQTISKALGKKLFFYEPWGYCSGLTTSFRKEQLVHLPASDQFVEQFEKLFPDGVGWNPLHQIDEEDK